MLSKIESILSVGNKKDGENKTPSSYYNNNSNSTPIKTNEEFYEDDNVFSTPILKEPLIKERPEPVKVDDIQLEKRSEDKIDLNRMASLLNGFNK